MATAERGMRPARHLGEIEKHAGEFLKTGYREVGEILGALGKLLEATITGPGGQRMLTRDEEIQAARLINGLASAMSADAEYLKLLYDGRMKIDHWPGSANAFQQVGDYVNLLESSADQMWRFSRYVYDRKLSSVLDDVSFALNLMHTGIWNSLGPDHTLPAPNVARSISLLRGAANDIIL